MTCVQVPSKACDCHVHVFGPQVRYPLAGDRAYTPPEASVQELVAFQERLRFERVVIVQPGVYGADKRLSAGRPAPARIAGARGGGRRDPRTVQPFDPIDDVAALARLHGWVGDPALFRKILVDNPARLYDF
jgi:predicted TIM-barrel fold metal-dependent hydrolase